MLDKGRADVGAEQMRERMQGVWCAGVWRRSRGVKPRDGNVVVVVGGDAA